MCVQICKDWDLSVHMLLTDLGWGITYLLIVHNKHPDIEAYNKLVSINDIIMGEQEEPDDPCEEEQRKRQLMHVKWEEKEDVEVRDSRKPNKGICNHMKGMQLRQTEAHRKKKQRMAT